MAIPFLGSMFIRKCYGGKSKPYIRGHPLWHFNLLMTTLRVETFKMNHSLQQIVLINAPESDRIVTSSSRISTIRNPNSIVNRSERALLKLCYELRNVKERIARHRNHLSFLYRCREKKIVPKGLRIKLSMNTPRTRRIVFHTSMSLVHERIYDVRGVIRKAEGDLERVKRDIKKLTTDDRHRSIDEWSDGLASRTFQETKESQREKLSCLLGEREAKQGPNMGHHLDQKKIVINMSTRPLSNSEESIPALGLYFVPTPTTIPERTIIAETEAVARGLDDESAAKLRSAVQTCLTNPKLPKSNMTKDQWMALKKLEEDKDIVVLPADKGNATVLLDKSEYNQKMNDLLKDASYKRLKGNPTTRVERKVADALKEVENRSGLSNAQRKYLVNNYSTPPQLYGLPKIHKNGHPTSTNRLLH